LIINFEIREITGGVKFLSIKLKIPAGPEAFLVLRNWIIVLSFALMVLNLVHMLGLKGKQ
jgi:hypothetical protein